MEVTRDGTLDYEAKVTRYVPEYKVPDQLGLSVDLDKAKWIDAEDLCPPGYLITELGLNMETQRGGFIF
jgi:hypothetical protein